MALPEDIQQLLGEAAFEGRCAFAADPAQSAALRKHWHGGRLARPYAGLFMERRRWDGLTACQRSMHVIRALHLKHPDWQYTALSGADIHGLPHAWHLHDGSVDIVDHTHNSGKRNRHAPLRRVSSSVHDAVRVSGIPVASLVHVVADCIRLLPFHHALSTVDGALYRGLTGDALEEHFRQAHLGRTRLGPVLEYAEGHDAGSLASLGRATLLALGFARPETQAMVTGPDGTAWGIDLLFRLPDGRRVALVFDETARSCDAGERRGRRLRPADDALLLACGVDEVLHCTYADVMVPRRYAAMLEHAGIPRPGVPRVLEAAAGDLWADLAA